MFYCQQGIIPPKRHTQFRHKSGALFIEEHISREGFSSIYSNVYHLKMPTEISEVGAFTPISFSASKGKHKNRHYCTSKISLSVRSPNV